MATGGPAGLCTSAGPAAGAPNDPGAPKGPGVAGSAPACPGGGVRSAQGTCTTVAGVIDGAVAGPAGGEPPFSRAW